MWTEADKFLAQEMRVKVTKEYFRRLTKILKSNLKGANLVQGLCTWVESF